MTFTTAPVAPTAHNHGHSHDHDHGPRGHDHGHHDPHDHGHRHGHSLGLEVRVHSRPDAPHFSLMRLSAAQRLAGAGGLIILLWACVWWALQ